MALSLSPFKSILKCALHRIPISILEKIEDAAQMHQGKGSGAWTTYDEAKSIAHYVKKLGISEVVAIDAGANVGNWTASMLEEFPSATILAFEPSQAAYLEFKKRFEENKKVQIFNLALGNQNKTSKLYSDKSGSGLGSLTKRRLNHYNIEFSHDEDVQIETLDTWIENQNLPKLPNVLKMDVEGHELEILLGASNTIASIQLVQFEFGGCNIDTRTFFQDFWYFFQGLGFSMYRLSPNSPIPVEAYSERDECFRATNYLAIRKQDV
jgi:FkbM family methyltransferase